MSPFDDFVHIGMETQHRNSLQAGGGGPPHPGSVTEQFYHNSAGQRPFTEGVIVAAIRKQHPAHKLSIVNTYLCDVLAFADGSPLASYSTHGDKHDMLTETSFRLPARRYGDEDKGEIVERVVFGCYDLKFGGKEFLLYVVEGQEAMYKTKYHYLLEKEEEEVGVFLKKAELKSEELIATASKWMQELHKEVLLFDQSHWAKSKDLYKNIQKANWEDVILDSKKKASIINDVIGFFNSEARYAEFGVPWKRGVIFYGPPGNGKTISTKALMHDVSKATSPKIESLYVKTFNTYAGPEYGIRMIFQTARQMAPCLLIFEDLDAMISPNVRSYFLNEVDGLESNHGILMIGSTNHLDRLDPGIAKRPSRFDRKYLFDVPNRGERVQYCEYWRHKLSTNKTVEFPEVMSARIADITQEFSFAYMKEAFVAALMVIVGGGEKREREVVRWMEDELAGNVFWKELKAQIENLRREMGSESESVSESSGTRLPLRFPDSPF